MPPITGTVRNWKSASLSISAGSAISASLIVAGRPVVGLLMPGFWTAASLSFDVSAWEGGRFYPLYSDSLAELTMKGSACRAIAACSVLDKLSSWYAMRVRSGCGVASVVDQASARQLTIFFQG